MPEVREEDIVVNLRAVAAAPLLSTGTRSPDATWLERAADEIERLRGLLREANDAFDECTGDYAKELVADEPWRRFDDGLPTIDEMLGILKDGPGA